MKSTTTTTLLIKSVAIALVLITLSHSVDAQQQPFKRRKQQRPNQQLQTEEDGTIVNRRQGQPTSSSSNTKSSAPSGSTPECPEDFGFFADAEQCDKYYVCENGIAKPKLCPDGLVFLEAGSSIEKCEFPFAVDCTTRPKLQTPQPSQNCPKKNGYFAHENEKICDKFFFCVDGAYNAITCPAGLVFNDKTGTCTWPDTAKKSFCSSEELFEFDCPVLPKHEAGQMIHPRYADPKDCQFFYVCIDGKIPRKSGCSTGQVFNEKNGQCDKPKNVPECKDWYKGILDYDEDGEIVTTTKRPPRQPQQQQQQQSGVAAAASFSSRRKGPKRPVVVVADDDEEQ